MSRDKSPTATVQAIGKLTLEGNIVPHSFFTRREFKSALGITQLLAILIYADDLYWYRPTEHRDKSTGQVVKITRKFEADKLQRSYDYYAGLFGVSKQQATDAVKFLVDRGLTTREFRTICLADGRRASNVMYVEPVVEALKVLLQADERGSDGWFWVAEPPKPNAKKSREAKREGTPNKRDTYPEHSGYVFGIDRRRIPNAPETNTETSLETSSKRGVSDATDDAHAQGQSPSALVVEPSPAQHSSGDAALQTSTHETAPVMDPPAEQPLPQAPGSPAATLERPAPDGVAADAALDPDVSQAEFDRLFGTPASTEALKDGPGAAGGQAAEAPRSPVLPPLAFKVADLLPIPPTELDSRAAAAPESETWKVLRALVGQKLPDYLSESTRTGGLSRKLWLKLEPTEIRQVMLTARLEVESSKGNLITVVVRGLDRLIGAVKAPEVDLTSVPAMQGGGALAPARKLELDLTPQVGKFEQGARWKPKAGGAEVTLVGQKIVQNRNGPGVQYMLSDDRLIHPLDLLLKFELVAPGHGPLDVQD